MNRFLQGTSLAGAVLLTASLAIAQPAASDTEAGKAGTPRGDCVDLSDGPPRTGSTEEMDAALTQDGKTAASGQDGATQSGSETEPAAGADSGTKPGGAGSSGWTGGTGGSDIGTSQTEELDSSPQQDHPAVASGLDPISGETAATGPQGPAKPDATPTDGTDKQAAADC
ncbi:hypothetical protein [Aquamicrobium terrae]|uniref:Oxidoreductase n=1 Tax=Aquamicrobium terrae TaxID=1324945 RepID=A0ABV2N0B2_9HYPH